MLTEVLDRSPGFYMFRVFECIVCKLNDKSVFIFSPLSCVAKKLKHETSGLGALGTASVSSFAPPLLTNVAPINFSSDEESPSMLRFAARARDLSSKKGRKNGQKFGQKSSNLDVDDSDNDLHDFKPERKEKKDSSVSICLVFHYFMANLFKISEFWFLPFLPSVTVHCQIL